MENGLSGLSLITAKTRFRAWPIIQWKFGIGPLDLCCLLPLAAILSSNITAAVSNPTNTSHPRSNSVCLPLVSNQTELPFPGPAPLALAS